MRRLSGQDAGFLAADTASANANISLLHIFDQATAAGGVVRFKAVLAQIERRLSAAPLFRQRLRRVPLALDHPYWVDDENFDLEYHVRHLALPKPGDWRQFCIQASRIHARALDMDRPLWEAYVIEGLDSFLDLPAGSFALLLKTHRAAVGLQQLAEISALLLDDSAQPPAAAPPTPWFAEAAPGRLSLLGGRTGRRLGSSLLRSASAPLRRLQLFRPQAQPATRFNSAVSPHRVFETRRFTEAEFQAVAGLVPGATLDDVVLAVCGGALRRYLAALAELPEQPSLLALRQDGQVRVLGTDIADPRLRLAAVQQQAAGPQAAAQRWTTRLPAAHCTLTGLPAPSKPLYLCGARLTYFSALLPISDGLGLAFAVTRYDGRVVISPTCCRELMPDPEVFALCLRDSFQAYLALLPRRRRRRAG